MDPSKSKSTVSLSLSNIKFKSLSPHQGNPSQRSLSLEKRRSNSNHAHQLIPIKSSKSAVAGKTLSSRGQPLLFKSRASNSSIASSVNDNNQDHPQQTYLIRSFKDLKSSVLASHLPDHAHQKQKSFLSPPEVANCENESEAFRAQVREAIMENKIFACNPRYPAVRKALQRRGWVEKVEHDFTSAESTSRTSLICSDDFSPEGNIDELDLAWMNRILRNYPPDFIFRYWRDKLENDFLLPNQILNQHAKSHFTNKVSITDRIQESHWHSEEGLAMSLFPRSYRLSNEEELIAFTNDYRITACLALLEWVVETVDAEGYDGLKGSNPGGSPSSCIDFAINQLKQYVRVRRHDDLDLQMPSNPVLPWDNFLSQYQNAVFQKMKLTLEDNTSVKEKYECAKTILENMKPYWPQRSIDGKLSVWICKPGAQARGRGIVVHNQLEKIMQLFQESPQMHWVVQKYIERPLLVYNTKFDIRQWFLVSDWKALTVWFYNECYLRFCSKPFDIEDFHESIHLCNNVVQSRYDVSADRNHALPKENMWDSPTFEKYLDDNDHGDLWQSKIRPGMKQSILAVLLSTQNHIDDGTRRNSFEIYGADFMLSADFTPWLIEINRSPCMEYTTSVTSRMCRQCLEDCIKVIVDRRGNPLIADTGLFELIYQGDSSPMPYKSQDPTVAQFVIQGKSCSKTF